jgi:hypothetical protein
VGFAFEQLPISQEHSTGRKSTAKIKDMNGLLKDILKEPWIWAILVMLLILWLSSCEKIDLDYPAPLRRYTVQEGKHDFTPSPLPTPGEAKSFSGVARLHASCWYDVLGVDNDDWNKLIGVYRWSDILKTKNSFILAWRPLNKIKNRFELCLYENIAGANVPHDQAIYQVDGGQEFAFDFDEINGKYTLQVNGVLLGKQRNDIAYTVIGRVGAYFGGNRTAPWTMFLEMNTN